MVVTLCQLTLHENLFYATREVGRLYETGRYLHNYGLTYALGLVVAPYFSADAVPRYAQDLALLNTQGIYVTPARPVAVSFEINTFKYADNRYRVKMEQSSRNTPSFGRAKELAAGSIFEFAIVSKEECFTPPSWIRLGKWMSKASLEVKQREVMENAQQGEFSVALPLNPLDVATSNRLIAYDLISMPPVSLVDNVKMSGSYYRLSDNRCIPTALAYRFPGA